MNRTTTTLAAGAFSLSALMATAAGAQNRIPNFTLDELGFDNYTALDECIHDTMRHLQSRIHQLAETMQHFPEILEDNPKAFADAVDQLYNNIQTSITQNTTDGLYEFSYRYELNLDDTGIFDDCTSESGTTESHLFEPDSNYSNSFSHFSSTFDYGD